jgi:hypothetical protein
MYLASLDEPLTSLQQRRTHIRSKFLYSGIGLCIIVSLLLPVGFIIKTKLIVQNQQLNNQSQYPGEQRTGIILFGMTSRFREKD